MECLLCDLKGHTEVAVALCPHCHIGLCVDHVNEQRRTPGPGGMNYTCHHERGQFRRTAHKLLPMELISIPSMICDPLEGCVC